MHIYLIVILPEKHSQGNVDHEEVQEGAPHVGAPYVGHKIKHVLGQGKGEHKAQGAGKTGQAEAALMAQHFFIFRELYILTPHSHLF